MRGSQSSEFRPQRSSTKARDEKNLVFYFSIDFKFGSLFCFYFFIFRSFLNLCIGAFSSGISISPITKQQILTHGYKSHSYNRKADFVK